MAGRDSWTSPVNALLDGVESTGGADTDALETEYGSPWARALREIMERHTGVSADDLRYVAPYQPSPPPFGQPPITNPQWPRTFDADLSPRQIVLSSLLSPPGLAQVGTPTQSTSGYTYLSHQYSHHGEYAAAEAIDRQLADRHPDDPSPLNSVATNKHSLQDQPEEAMEVIDRALEVARRTGTLRRYTLGNKARIALDLKRYDIVENVLKEIMALNIDPALPDIGRERDFFDRLPPDSIDPDVARQYNEYCLAVGRLPPEK